MDESGSGASGRIPEQSTGWYDRIEDRLRRQLEALGSDSRWAVEQWINQHAVEGVPAALALQLEANGGDEAYFMPRVIVDTSQRYVRRTTAKR